MHGLYNHQGLNSFLQLHQAEDGVLFYSILDEGPVVAQVEKKKHFKKLKNQQTKTHEEHKIIWCISHE